MDVDSNSKNHHIKRMIKTNICVCIYVYIHLAFYDGPENAGFKVRPRPRGCEGEALKPKP